MKSPYDVLGLPAGAALGEVKARYRALARAHHPDKLHGLSEEERRAHEEKFKEITAAYHVIIGGGTGSGEGAAGKGWQDIWRRVQAMLANRDLWDALRGAVQKTRTHVVELDVTLEDIYHNRARKLRLILNGIAEPVYVTAYCGNYPQVDIPYVPRDAIDPIPHTVRIVLRDVEHPVYTISELLGTLDLYTSVSLSWAEYIRGVRRELIGLDGGIVTVEVPPFCQEKFFTMPGLGIRGGSLYVSVVVRRPVSDEWNEEVKCRILEILEEAHRASCA